ncbi:MAG: Gfo/Idh/MocA family oxidoreductase [Bdellovibrionia bacterium]
MPTKLRFAVVGLGHIAQIAILPGFLHTKESQLVALVSSDKKKLKVLGKKYGVKNLYSYELYDHLLKSGKIDAVFIALPNHLHKDFTIRAARAGIHVLCEKPMAVTSEECREMIQACEKSKIKLMIAYRLHVEESHLKTIQLIHTERKLGDLKIFQSIHCQTVRLQNIRTLPVSQGGGPTYDIGIYDINAARYIFRDEPISLFAQSSCSEQWPLDDVEETMSVTLNFPGGRIASIIFSFGAFNSDTFRIIGTKGELSLDPAYTYLGAKTLKGMIRNKSKTWKFQARDHFAGETDYFSNCVLNNSQIEPSGQEGLADIRIIEAILESAQTGKVIKLPKTSKTKRPKITQKINRPKAKKTKLVHVKPPSVSR